MKKTHKIILAVVLILIILVSLYDKVCEVPIIKEYDSLLPGPNIIFVTATHGNEYAPHYAVVEYLKHHHPRKGKLTHITVNRCGLFFNNREQGPFDINNDINRKYITSNNKNDINKINQTIMDNIKGDVLIIDFHESNKLHYHYSNYIGNTITFNTNYTDVDKMIEILNNKYPGSKWCVGNTPQEDIPEDRIQDTLYDYCTDNGIRYILIETYRNGKLKTRMDHTETILNYIFDKYFD